jgi:hypothetical protein
VSSIGRHIWSYPDVGRTGDSVQGYTVQAADGRVGKVDRAATAMDSHCLVVGTGTWIFGKRIVLPAGVIEAINDEQQEVWVALTKEQISEAPELDVDAIGDEQPRDQLGEYYGRFFMNAP